MFTHYRTKGIFLKQEGKGEADQLLTVFSEDFGKIEVLGRAVRKITSKLRSGADIFYLSEIEFIQGKNYKTLTDALVIEKFENIRNNPEKLETAYRIVEILDFLTGYEEQDQKIWKLLRENLDFLNNLIIQPFNHLSFYFFFWQLISILGYYPELYHCSVCGKKLLPEIFYFSPKDGGVVCWQCFKNFEAESKKQAEEIKVNTVKVLRLLPQKPIRAFVKIKLEKKEMENLERISELYLDFLKEELSKAEKE